jgi:hypothetical protein
MAKRLPENTVDQMELRLQHWCRKLGLREWRVTIDWDTPVKAYAMASVNVPHQTFDAEVMLDPSWKTWTETTIDEILVHELLHLSLRNLERAADSAGDLLGKEASVVWDNRLQHELELFIERMAHVVVAL